MITLTVDIADDKDLPVIREVLTRFGLKYKITKGPAASKTEEKLSKKLKKSFSEI
jgi:hypothetical protein